jgi:hypothetical protein
MRQKCVARQICLYKALLPQVQNAAWQSLQQVHFRDISLKTADFGRFKRPPCLPFPDGTRLAYCSGEMVRSQGDEL